MIVTRFIYARLLPAMLGGGLLASAATTASSDPCIKLAGLQYADPADVMACQKSFPFNETLRQNIISVFSGLIDFYTFENYYLNLPPPFQDSTKDIRAEISRINTTQYTTDYDLNLDMWNFTTQMNDGHTRYAPNCYLTYQNILPAPVVLFGDRIFIDPHSPEFLPQLGSNFTGFFAAKYFDYQRLAGAEVISIEGMPASDYIEMIARNVSGSYLDLNIRVGSAFSSYMVVGTDFYQRVGDFAGRYTVTQTSINLSLMLVNSTTPEFVDVPFVAHLVGASFKDGPSYWANNCAVTSQTNGVDQRSSGSSLGQSQSRLARAVLKSDLTSPGVNAPDPFLPTLTPANGNNGAVKSYLLPGNKTGVMFIGTFGSHESDFTDFPRDVHDAVTQFQASRVTNLLIDVSNNPGGLVYLGYFLFSYLAGTESGSPEFQSTNRANLLAQKIVKADIDLGINSSFSVYAPDNWQFPNGTQMSNKFDYNDPSVPNVINGVDEPNSQRFEDLWPATPDNSNYVNVTFPYPDKPPFDLKKVVIIGNGRCGSTCAMFTTAMHERLQTKIAIFGGNMTQPIEYKGAGGNQVLEWAELNTEIKTAGLRDDALAPPDLMVNVTMILNWRTAYSNINESLPIAYVSEPAQHRFPYTAETYNNPQQIWLFAEKQFFG